VVLMDGILDVCRDGLRLAAAELPKLTQCHAEGSLGGGHQLTEAMP
jgi:hypothetical protein